MAPPILGYQPVPAAATEAAGTEEQVPRWQQLWGRRGALALAAGLLLALAAAAATVVPRRGHLQPRVQQKALRRPLEGQKVEVLPACPPGTVPNGLGGCVLPSLAPASPTSTSNESEVSFYMYRAQDDQNYYLENVNTATLAGVMWYLEKEVVRGTCPRHYGITRILRLRVTMRQLEGSGRHFARFVAFDRGKCTTPGCTEDFEANGYTVGCQRQVGTPYSPNPVWYSLPGACPSVEYPAKTPACRAALPGGRCAKPTGEKNCTWSLEDAGEISIAELEGIPDYDAFCKAGGNEYLVSFWDGRGSAPFNEARMKKAEGLFQSRYPDMPKLPEPPCDWA